MLTEVFRFGGIIIGRPRVQGSVEFGVRRSELGVRRLLAAFAGYGCFLLSNFTTTTIM